MRVLVVGAGAVGGYFGGRLLEKGEDVTFLVREKRKEKLDRDGLLIKSVHGNISLKPRTLLSGETAKPFDVIFLSTKAYHLQNAIESIRPYVNKETMILPLLNGIAHISELIKVFGEGNVLGGLCFIETALDETGNIIQSSAAHDLIFGERNREKTNRILTLQNTLSGTKAAFKLSENILQDMWHKYLFITMQSGVCSLFRSPTGPIRDHEFGMKTIHRILKEACGIMRAIGAPISDQIEEIHTKRIMEMGYNMKTSLQRDMEKQMPIEADHLYGYLLDQARSCGFEAPILETIYANLKIYEASLL